MRVGPVSRVSWVGCDRGRLGRVAASGIAGGAAVRVVGSEDDHRPPQPALSSSSSACHCAADRVATKVSGWIGLAIDQTTSNWPSARARPTWNGRQATRDSGSIVTIPSGASRLWRSRCSRTAVGSAVPASSAAWAQIITPL